MKLTRAIEVNQDLLTDGPYWPEEERREAIKLLIEAGKGILAYRKWGRNNLPQPLPGETSNDL